LLNFSFVKTIIHVFFSSFSSSMHHRIAVMSSSENHRGRHVSEPLENNMDVDNVVSTQDGDGMF
jgi:hypothetical protein